MFKETLEKLKNSQSFSEFKKENKNAFLFSAFFILDSDFIVKTRQVDFFIEKGKVVTFSVNQEINSREDRIALKRKILPLNEKIEIDIDQLKRIAEKTLKEKKIKLEKAIAILQREKEKQKEKQFWTLILLGGLKIVKMQIDCFSGEILKIKEYSFFDFVKK